MFPTPSLLPLQHVPALYAAIRHRALCQYVQPFSSVDLAVMAAALNTPVAELEKQLAGLIMDGAISARIDSATKVRRGWRKSGDWDSSVWPRAAYTCSCLKKGQNGTSREFHGALAPVSLKVSLVAERA